MLSLRHLTFPVVLLGALLWASPALAGAGPPVAVKGGVLFTLEAPDAGQVYIAGEFNAWSTTTDLMKKDAAGLWSIVLPLEAGRYEYKYVVDGQWMEDPLNPVSVPDPYGGKNSAVVVGGEVEVPVGTTAARSPVPGGTVGPPVPVEGGILFTLEAIEAREVYLAGDFNGWSPSANLMEQGKDGVWRIVLPLEVGRYEYKFVVDGVWKEDPNNSQTVPDPYGGKNSVLTVGGMDAPPAIPTKIPEAAAAAPVPVEGGVLFTFEAIEAREVYLAGEFNGWSPSTDLMTQGKNGVWRTVLPLAPGRYQYKFVVDGVWKEDPNNPETVPDPYGGKNSVLTVGEGTAPAAPAKAKAPAKTIEGKAGPPAAVEGGILFTWEAADAKEVYVAGSFNAWSPTAALMERGADGVWRTVLPLAPGRYEYKFVVDGQWTTDSKNPDSVADPYGGQNSVVTVEEGGAVRMGAAAPAPATEAGKPVVGTLTSKGKPIYVALLWHQHQPKYMKNPKTGEYAEPWVRIHSIKDYYDMVAILGDYPGMKLTVNLTPVLLMQLDEIIQGYDRWKKEGGRTLPGADQWIRLTLTPPEELTREEKAYVLRNFFRMPWDTMLDIYPRFKELASMKKGDSDAEIAATIERYTDQDFRDLQAWFNLAEFDPDFKEGEVELPSGRKVGVSHLIRKGRNFTEADKREIIDAQMEVLRSVVAVHKKFQEKGQIEVITTPFFHPILPLIYDTDLARVAMPGVPLPEPAYRWPDDAAAHLRMAQEDFRQRFGRPARGLWPSEGSVAEAIVPLVADAGFQWMASDEEVLAASLAGRAFGNREKYRAWWTEKDGRKVAVLFRDRAISDAIGFNYSKMDGVTAANDLIQKLYAIHKEFATKPGDCIVPIILDGENAWEHYPRDGKDFLRSMYDQISRAPWLKPVTIGAFLDAHPPEETIDTLWPGSWIAHNFATWIGEPEENQGWALLAETRAALEAYRKSPGASAASVERAFGEMYAAEGSDWFWWYGKDQSSGNDEFFDEAFRSLLRNVYTAIGRPVPDKLWTPIVMPAAAAPMRRLSGPMTPTIDGREGAGEWAQAGLIEDEEGGAMQRGSGDPVRALLYGYDSENLYLRVETGSGAPSGSNLRVYFSLPDKGERNVLARAKGADGNALSFGFPLGSEARVPAGGSGSVEFSRAQGGNRWSSPERLGKCAAGQGIEMSVPFTALGAGSLEPMRLVAVLETDGVASDVVPDRGGVELVTPERGDLKTWLSVKDPVGDDHGPGTYTYPTNPVFEKGVFDVTDFTVLEDPAGWVLFRLAFAGPVTNPWGGRDGFSLQGIDLYLDTDGKPGSGSTDLFENRKARTTPESAWEFFVRVSMDEVAVYRDPKTLLTDSQVLVRADPATSTITARVPTSVIGRPSKDWHVIACVVSHEGLFSAGKARAILPQATEWEFGGGNGRGPTIIDLVAAGAGSQERILSSYRQSGSVAEIPGIRLEN